MKTLTLRSKIEESKTEHMKKYGALDWRWRDEVLVWTLTDYHSHVGSVLDFTEDDWRVCKENGLSLYEVLSFCGEQWFNEEVDEIGRYIGLALECWRNEELDARDEDVLADEDIPKDIVDALIADFFTWRKEKLPVVMAVYKEG